MSAPAAEAVTGIATSADGTPIAWEHRGTGPVLVLVDGALCDRSFGPARPVTDELADAFTVVSYDRRGRGESGDTAPYAVEREIEDLAAVVDAAKAATGASEVDLLGQSSGAGLVYRAAAAGIPVRRIIGYEAPFVGLRPGTDGRPHDYLGTVETLLADGKNGKAVDYFMVDMVGGPGFLPIMFRLMRGPWKHLRAVAPTLPNDIRVMGGDFEVPTGLLAGIRVPALVMAGTKSPGTMREAQRRIAEAIPGALHRELEKQTHQVAPSALSPEVRSFLLG
ncbi:alpha/beta fold hydrolase [Protaetiibacter mangrovi]|uniref:Alpha/beta hydrolase n=1 Tax=Protaetiibacter mangrovi TaxID=2970926 RepID=A0ABT1ZIJ3_9MICO|nr:alpha/beta hydrolase [Protaetiibacter mangrovi]MCS0500537.1 alpha/beta hydrolase [Protaetiibacter mangrovi]TPX04538.1 alpha/beta hydrolase [Schumannella luteola]